MAIAGSPGIPSVCVYIRGNQVLTAPIAQNKPKLVVDLDLDLAILKILDGERVQVDVRGGNLGVVVRRVIALSGGTLTSLHAGNS